jgi:Neurotransmitter-gated ion-channel ligand binding domain
MLTCSFRYSVTQSNDAVLYSKVRIHYDGFVSWTRIGQFTAACDVDITWFPFDHQKCTMTFMSWDDSDEVTIYSLTEDNSIKNVVTDGEWRIVGKYNKFMVVEVHAEAFLSFSGRMGL